MNLELVKKIADAVLYEGYLLYPYRASSVKNRQRFNWGALAPESYSAAQKGTEAFEMQTECLLKATDATEFDVKVRFLHLVLREIGKLDAPLDELPADFTDFHIVPTLEVGRHLYQTWQEAIEREVDLPTLNVNQISEIKQFTFPATGTLEPLRDENGKIVGVFVRSQQEIVGEIESHVHKIEHRNVYQLTVKIKNQTALENANEQSRDDALMHSLVSTHTILTTKNGEFVSLLEPPDELSEAVSQLENIKTYPVLAGEEGATDCMFSSPIILYDYPQIAAESQGDLFDGGEIDEILTLRIMTLTDNEKREMRGIDEHARKILERTENMSDEQLMKMHGAMKGAAKASKENN